MKSSRLFFLCMNIFRLFIACSLFSIIHPDCAVNPVTGKKEFMLLSQADEIALGAETDKQIIETYGLYDDPGLNIYISEIGGRMGRLTHRPDLKYSFKVLDTPVINAFAVPGGYIYFTRGILAHFNNEAEMAGVLGHELGHVNARHTAKQYSHATLAQLGLGVGMMISEDFRKIAGIAQFGVGMLFLRFSRDNERQADDLGVEYSSKAGYNANTMAEFFETLERMHPGSNQSGLPGWFSTHPNPKDRVAAVKAKTVEWQQKLNKNQYAMNRNEYLEKVDGIVFGEDPRQGYVETNVFYHPTLRFSFPIPGDWQVNNMPSQVQMVSKNEDAIIILSLDQSDSPSQAADKFTTNIEGTIQSSNALTVNSLPAHKVISAIQAEGNDLRVMSYFIEKEDNIYVFHGFTTSNNYSKYAPHFTNTMGGFKHLRNPSRIRVKPDRLILKTVSRKGSLRNVLRRFRVAEDKLEAMAILNGMHPDDQIAANTRIKIITK